MSDSQSFPIKFNSNPISAMADYGAYYDNQVYTMGDLAELTDYANYRGEQIRVKVLRVQPRIIH